MEAHTDKQALADANARAMRVDRIRARLADDLHRSMWQWGEDNARFSRMVGVRDAWDNTPTYGDPLLWLKHIIEIAVDHAPPGHASALLDSALAMLPISNEIGLLNMRRRHDSALKRFGRAPNGEKTS